MAESKTIARPYAKAILANAKDKEQQQNWQLFLHAAKEILSTPEVANYLALPHFEKQLQSWLVELLQKYRSQEDILPEEKNLLRLLQDHDRIAVLPEIADLYDELLYQSQNICSVTVKSAQPLSTDEIKALENAMRKKTGRDVVLHISKDESLLAGVLIEYDGLVIDQTLKGRITGFARQLDD